MPNAMRLLTAEAAAWAAVVVVYTLAGARPARAESEIARLLPADGAPHAYFGFSVTVSGDTAVIGAGGDNENGWSAGAAYVFGFDGSEWVQQAKLLASDGAAEDCFGYAVALSGDATLIGAVDDDDNGASSGSAYVFRFDGSSWTEEAKLVARDGAAQDWFACSVAIAGDTALVGAFRDDQQETDSGSAYVFRFDGLNWVDEAKLMPADAVAYGCFGFSVAVSGDVALIGAPEDDDNGFRSGSVYVFRYDGSRWNFEAKLLPDDGVAFDRFGCIVALDGDVAVIGMPEDDDNGTGSGSAYVFRYDGAGWAQEAKLLPSDGATYEYFGYAVAISGNIAVISARHDQDNGPQSGSAYVFRFDGSGWIEQAKLLPSDGQPDDNFGYSAALAGETALFGVPYDDENGDYSGSAYVFDVVGPGCLGDVDGDGDTDLNDLAALLAAYGTSTGDPGYDANADVDADGDVDLSDLASLLGDYGCGG